MEARTVVAAVPAVLCALIWLGILVAPAMRAGLIRSLPDRRAVQVAAGVLIILAFGLFGGGAP